MSAHIMFIVFFVLVAGFKPTFFVVDRIYRSRRHNRIVAADNAVFARKMSHYR